MTLELSVSGGTIWSITYCRQLCSSYFYNSGHCSRYHKHVTCVIYDPSKLTCTILPLHSIPADCMTSSIFQNELAYFAMSYTHKIFIKLTPVNDFIKQ
jgi:hypothetical protein